MCFGVVSEGDFGETHWRCLKNSDSNSNTNNSDRILERKQWYVACIVRAIKACAMLTELAQNRRWAARKRFVERVRVFTNTKEGESETTKETLMMNISMDFRRKTIGAYRHQVH